MSEPEVYTADVAAVMRGWWQSHFAVEVEQDLVGHLYHRSTRAVDLYHPDTRAIDLCCLHV